MIFLFFFASVQAATNLQLTDDLNAIKKKQSDIYSLLRGKASKAGARHIIHLIETLSENKVDKESLEQSVQLLQDEILQNRKLLKVVEKQYELLSSEIKKISNNLINIASEASPHQEIQILAEIKNEQKNIKERVIEFDNQLQKISTQYVTSSAKSTSRHQTDFSKLISTQSELSDTVSVLKEDVRKTKTIAHRYLMLMFFFFVLIISALGAWMYYFINQQKRLQEEILDSTKVIVKSQFERLLEQLYTEEHEDGRLTVDDLKKMSERVKKKVIRQNWAKRKVEERPAFI